MLALSLSFLGWIYTIPCCLLWKGSLAIIMASPAFDPSSDSILRAFSRENLEVKWQVPGRVQVGTWFSWGQSVCLPVYPVSIHSLSHLTPLHGCTTWMLWALHKPWLCSFGKRPPLSFLPSLLDGLIPFAPTIWFDLMVCSMRAPNHFCLLSKRVFLGLMF